MTDRIVLRSLPRLTGLALIGCSTMHAPAAGPVRFTSNVEAVRGCRYVGPVSADAIDGRARVPTRAGALPGEAIYSEIELPRGANTVLVIGGRSTSASPQGGTAYACPVEPSPGAPRDSARKPR